MSVHRIIGTETEYGVYRPGEPMANAVALSAQAVAAYARISRKNGSPVQWDYTGEDPLNDLRGMRLSRAAADPSLLTDDPYHLAPPGGSEILRRPSAAEMALPTATNVVLANGARLYVDHAHPEYATPETYSPKDAVLWDRAGEIIARRIMDEIARAGEKELVLVKNNTDGKGAAYGTHENYSIRRDIDLDDLIRGITPFMVTRPIFCGAGRVGIGQKSQIPGFQISQRADFVENEVGLETTFNRPIVNTRDEPHADPTVYRRFHVIGGDGNLFDISAYLRFGTTSLVLWAIEQGIGLEWDSLALADPVRETWNISHDPTVTFQMTTVAGEKLTAIEMQQHYLDLVRKTFDRLGIQPDSESENVVATWQSVIDRMHSDIWSVASDVEWVAKYQLLSRLRERSGMQWADPRLTAFDLQWADLRASHSPVERLDAAGRVTRLFTLQQLEGAADNPPSNTRAYLRGRAVSNVSQLVKASWTSLVVDDPGRDRLLRRVLPQPESVDEELEELINKGRII